jgi:hypothetical protein
MTRPTGRPRGRPKIKEYVTLMARVPQEMADRVKRYAAAQRQPLSVVIRDALILLMEEYPSGDAGAGPHRLAAQEFLSDRYESALDMLLGETDSAGLEALLSDTNEEAIKTLMLGVNSRPDIVSDTKPDDAHILSDAKAGIAAFASDVKRDDRTPDVKEILSDIMSDMKEAKTEAKTESTPAPAILSDTNVPTFDTTKYVLGKLCPRGHDYHGTGQSLRRLPRSVCLECDAEWARDRRRAKRQVT